MAKQKTDFETLDISTRPKRRKAVALVIMALVRICSAEEAYLDRIPDNLQGGDACAAAEDSIDFISEAISNLVDAY